MALVGLENGQTPGKLIHPGDYIVKMKILLYLPLKFSLATETSNDSFFLQTPCWGGYCIWPFVVCVFLRNQNALLNSCIWRKQAFLVFCN